MSKDPFSIDVYSPAWHPRIHHVPIDTFMLGHEVRLRDPTVCSPFERDGGGVASTHDALPHNVDAMFW